MTKVARIIARLNPVVLIGLAALVMWLPGNVPPQVFYEEPLFYTYLPGLIYLSYFPLWPWCVNRYLDQHLSDRGTTRNGFTLHFIFGVLLAFIGLVIQVEANSILAENLPVLIAQKLMALVWYYVFFRLAWSNASRLVEIYSDMNFLPTFLLFIVWPIGSIFLYKPILEIEELSA